MVGGGLTVKFNKEVVGVQKRRSPRNVDNEPYQILTDLARRTEKCTNGKLESLESHRHD